MTTAYRIKDVAERTGFTPTTLRYYEEIGLLPEAARTDAGYRLYDDDTVDRLAFIARAKQLGCSLEEIAGLVAAWDGGQCGPVQDGLRTLVAAKLASAQERIVELMTLTAELRQAAASLEHHRPQGPCDDSCGCVAGDGPEAVESPVQAVHFTRKQVAATPVAPATTPIACTLPPAQFGRRVDDWRSLLDAMAHRQPIDGGVRLTFTPGTSVVDLARLAAAEHDCCRFFRFALTIDDRGTGLEVTAPDDAIALVDTVFGAPA